MTTPMWSKMASRGGQLGGTRPAREGSWGQSGWQRKAVRGDWASRGRQLGAIGPAGEQLDIDHAGWGVVRA